MNHQVVSKTWTVFSVHPHSKLLLERHESKPLEVPAQRKDEGLPRRILFVLPIVGGAPGKRAESANEFAEFSFCDSEGIPFAIAELMKGLG